MKSQFSKKLLAASILAAVASTASAADKAPTLADVLKSSGIDVTGYIDVAYNSLSTNPGTFTGHAYDTEHSSFNLHAFDLSVSMLPASGFGGLVEVQYGTDTNFNRSANPGNSVNTQNSTEALLQSFLQYQKGPFAVMGGKFTTLAGAEVPQAINNTNYSRSFLFTFAIPVTHTGARANYAFSDTFKLMGGVLNGWDTLTQSGISASANPGKTYELGVSASPAKIVSVAASYYTGDANGAGAQIGTRTLTDVVVTLTLSEAMNLVFNYDNGTQDRGLAGGGSASWSGLAGYFNYKFSDTWRVSVRAETFKDNDGFRTGTAQTLTETTFTVGFAPAKNMELRGEVRLDKSDKNPFTDNGPKNSQTELAVEAVYKF